MMYWLYPNHTVLILVAFNLYYLGQPALCFLLYDFCFVCLFSFILWPDKPIKIVSLVLNSDSKVDENAMIRN